MDTGVSLLLAHEMPGVDWQAARNGCEFGNFFACDEGATPEKLLKGNIYRQIATPLKGSEWRKASMVMVAKELAEKPGAPEKRGLEANSSRTAPTIYDSAAKERDESSGHATIG